MTQVHVHAVRHDRIEETRTVLCDGAGTFTDGTLIYKDCEPYAGEDRITFGEDAVVIHHAGDTESVMMLKKKGIGTAEIRTPYGTMFCETKLLEYRRTPEEVYIEYQIFQDGGLVSHIALEYRMKAFV